MSSVENNYNFTSERKIRFRPDDRILFNNENKVEDLFRNETVIDKEPKKKEKTPSLFSFLQVEMTRGYMLEHDEERFSARREKVYSFMKIPREVEKFMTYGFFQCADSFLFVYTFLPVRFALALWGLVTRPILECFGMWKRKSKTILTPAEICDLLKSSIIIACSAMMFQVDTNMMYHLIKSQSVIKLYIFYNMLEVGDRLFSAFGQDTIDALFWTATEPRDRRREHLGLIPHILFAVAYVFLHSFLVLFQATTLNVAINSNNKALLTIMMSNNFVELKGSVFKKFDKNNLFQVSCSDVRERFHLFILLFIVVLQTMKEYSWKEERFWVLVPDCFMVLFAEVDVYKDYTTSLAYDMAQTRQKHAFSDHSDLVARRMGFIPLPLGVVMIRVLGNAIQLEGIASLFIFIIAYLCLYTFRILNGLIILGKACDFIAQHRQEKASVQSPSTSAASKLVSPTTQQCTTTANGKPTHTSFTRDLFKDTATSPLKPTVPVTLPQRSHTLEVLTVQNSPDISNLESAAIFANSSVDLKNACLNEELLRVEEDEIELQETSESDDTVSRSVPNIKSELDVEQDKIEILCGEMATVTSMDVLLKRAESEPSIALSSETDTSNQGVKV
ncbi:uncharacterized protein CBL_12214 [Carabus blaptoides fortunei]